MSIDNGMMSEIRSHMRGNLRSQGAFGNSGLYSILLFYNACLLSSAFQPFFSPLFSTTETGMQYTGSKSTNPG